MEHHQTIRHLLPLYLGCLWFAQPLSCLTFAVVLLLLLLLLPLLGVHTLWGRGLNVIILETHPTESIPLTIPVMAEFRGLPCILP